MALKKVIHRWCQKCGALKLHEATYDGKTDYFYYPCHKCAPPGPLAPFKRININEVVIDESRPN